MKRGHTIWREAQYRRAIKEIWSNEKEDGGKVWDRETIKWNKNPTTNNAKSVRELEVSF